MIQINTGFLTKQAVDKISDSNISVKTVGGYAWLMAVRLPGGQTVAAYPISRLNPLAPPLIYMTDKECGKGVDNREYPSKIHRVLKRWCKDDGLLDGIKLLRKAIKLLES